MLSFATDFPVSFGTTTEDFMGVVRGWIAGSPHTPLTDADLSILQIPGRAVAARDQARVDSLRFCDESSESAAVRYVIQEGAMQWMTLATFSRDRLDAWVSVRTFCESLHAAASLPPAKKPILVQQLLERLQRGDDAGLVTGAPINLTSADMGLAVDLITGRAGNRMPVVYVSASFGRKHAVSIGRFSRRLAGMAHLIIEPSRSFSLRLRAESNSENVYGGTVGIYWPDSGGRRSQFRPWDFDSTSDMESAIEDELRAALINRRPLDRCTYSAVDSAISRSEIEHHKRNGDKGFDDYAAHFDVELQAKQEALENAEREIARLKAEVREQEKVRAVLGGVSFSAGSEQDLYPGEVLDSVLLTLKDAVDRTPEGTRRRHLIDAILGANELAGGASRGREKLKEALRGYRSLDKKTRNSLEELGFSIDHSAKHPRAVFQGDERYAFVLPSTGSDHRGGLNAASDLAKLVF